MPLRLIVGPMKSGKSFDLIARFAPLEHSNIRHILYQSVVNEREDSVASRSGLKLAAKKITAIPRGAMKYDVIGLDEIHFFPLETVDIISELLQADKEVVACGLDMDYRGKMFPIIKALMELAPIEVQYRRAVCETCKKLDATYTQVYKDGKPLLSGFPSILVEDGRYTYAPVCRQCFVQAE